MISPARQTDATTDYEQFAAQLKVLADSRRLRIIDLLMDGVQCNCEIGDHLEMAPNLISHHLGILRKAGLIITERDPVDARWVYYSINEQMMEQLSQRFSSFFDVSKIKPRRPDCGPASRC